MNNNDIVPGNDDDTGAGRWLAALDTSTTQTGIALTDGDAVLDLSLPGGRAQTRECLPLLDWLLRQHRLTSRDIGAVAVAIGPGSFTGLRVGLSIAKGLAIAQGVAVIGVPTLDAVAWPYRATGLPLLAVLPAGRSRLVWAWYSPGGDSVLPRNGTLAELREAVAAAPESLVIGEMPAALWDSLLETHPRLAPRLAGVARAVALAELGVRRWRAGEVDTAATLEPIYLHGKRQPS